HVSEHALLPPASSLKSPPLWVPKSHSPHCGECGERFGWFFPKRHWCRLCGELFCFTCLSRSQVLPDYDFDRPHEGHGGKGQGPNGVKICGFCFGKENSEYGQDLLVASDKRTEIMGKRAEQAKHASIAASFATATCVPCPLFVLYHGHGPRSSL